MDLIVRDVQEAQAELRFILGGGADDEGTLERARGSSLRLARDHAHLGFWFGEGPGWALAPFEALKAFGRPALTSMLEAPIAAIVHEGCRVSEVIAARRLAIQLEPADVADAAGLEVARVVEAEGGRRSIPIGHLRRIGPALGLDDLLFGTLGRAAVAGAVGVRLRVPTPRPLLMTKRDVLAIMEAVWVVTVQTRLASWLGRDGAVNRYSEARSVAVPTDVPSAWRQGADLARALRSNLGLHSEQPIDGLARWVTSRFGIPVIGAELSPSIAGVTLTEGGARGIVVNTRGANARPGTRRISIAHELGHVLFDSDRRLAPLRIRADAPYGEVLAMDDPIEARAQAFASELVAPAAAAVAIFKACRSDVEGLGAVMATFGIGRRAAARQVENGTRDASVWKAVDVVPLGAGGGGWSEIGDGPDAGGVPLSRCGPFADMVVRAVEEGVISHDSAAGMLRLDVHELDDRMDVASDGPSLRI